MALKIVSALMMFLVVFLSFVATRDAHFHYERSGVINASAEKIFPYLSNFKLGSQWNPYDRKDPAMKRTFSGADGQVGSAMDFAGNREAGAGRLEILKIIANQTVQLRLLMTKPITADNLIIYTLTPEGSATRFTWAMEGDGGFMGKLLGVFMNCEKMVAKDLEAGIATLKSVVESQK